jgi:hypothetical protein
MVFVIELHSPRVHVVGPTRFPDEAFVVQAMRHLSDDIDGVLGCGRVLICDRDRNGVVLFGSFSSVLDRLAGSN